MGHPQHFNWFLVHFGYSTWLLLLLNAPCLAEKHQLLILKSLVSPDDGSNTQSTRGEKANYYTTEMIVLAGCFFLYYKTIIIPPRWSFQNSPLFCRYTSLIKLLAIFLRTSGAILGTLSLYSPISHKILALAIGTAIVSTILAMYFIMSWCSLGCKIKI